MDEAPKDRPEGGWPERQYPDGNDPRIVWAMQYDEGYEAGWDRGYKRGLEEAAKIAEDEAHEDCNVAEQIAAAIRAMMQEGDDD